MSEKEEDLEEEDSSPSWLAWLLLAIFLALLLAMLAFYWIQLMGSNSEG